MIPLQPKPVKMTPEDHELTLQDAAHLKYSFSKFMVECARAIHQMAHEKKLTVPKLVRLLRVALANQSKPLEFPQEDPFVSGA